MRVRPPPSPRFCATGVDVELKREAHTFAQDVSQQPCPLPLSELVSTVLNVPVDEVPDAGRIS